MSSAERIPAFGFNTNVVSGTTPVKLKSFEAVVGGAKFTTEFE